MEINALEKDGLGILLHEVKAAAESTDAYSALHHLLRARPLLTPLIDHLQKTAEKGLEDPA